MREKVGGGEKVLEVGEGALKMREVGLGIGKEVFGMGKVEWSNF